MLLLLATGGALAAAAVFGGFDPKLGNSLLFGAWLAALLVLFGLGLRLTLPARLSKWPSLARSGAIVLAALAVAVIANVGLYLHDMHFDLTAERLSALLSDTEMISAARRLAAEIASLPSPSELVPKLVAL